MMYENPDELYDFDSLREDLISECSGAFFVGHFGGAAMEASEIRNASDEELLKLAERNGIHIERYRIG